jgi:hypothetical protein
MPKTSALKREAVPGQDHNSRPLVEEEILTSREARTLLKIGRTKLHELTHMQAIPAFRVGSGRTSGLRYRKTDLLEWLYSQRVRG